MKRKFFTLLLCGFIGTVVMAQEVRTGGIKKTDVAPEVDGVIDDVWATANTYSVDQPFQKETPTLGEAGTTTWKALWTDDGVFILVTVTDDDFYPGYKNNDAGTDWKYDKPEIYFDVNSEKKDGIGGGGGKGHYQFAPGFGDGSKNDGTPTTGTDGVKYAFKVTEPNYVGEYFIPFSKLLDKDGNDIDVFSPIGFDVSVIDGDSNAPGVRQRAVWSNIGAINESYGNMDDCALVTLDPFPLEGNVVKKAATAPIVDGVVDAIWSTSNVFNIDKPFQNNKPTLGESGTTTWKALWNEDGVYIIVQVNDDEFYAGYMNNDGSDWKYDKPELYFDVNAIKQDGVGTGSGKGHYQVSPGFGDGSKNDGTSSTGSDGVSYAFKVTDPTYVGEYFIPWSKFVDKDGVDFDKSTPMGFDVTVIDGEKGTAPAIFNRAVWSNIGAINESYGNMDDCETIVFEGTQNSVLVDAVTVSGGTITTDNGTLQLTYSLLPANATNKKVKWSVVNGTGQAKITADGLLTGLTNGTVTVSVAAKDGGYSVGTAIVTISGQKITQDDIWNSFNLITNFNFTEDENGLKNWNGWKDYGGMAAGATDPVVEDGVCVMQSAIANEGTWWHYQHNQEPMTMPEAFVPYTMKFKMWASQPDQPAFVVFEDTANDTQKLGASPDPEAQNGRTEWRMNISDKPTWYTLHVTFDKLVSNTVVKAAFMLSLSNATFYLDSVLVVKDADLLLSTKELVANTIKVYPNPVQTELTVTTISVVNSKVSVYNAVGQKLIEKIANGTQVKFDVANLRKGMYFIRFSDGSSQKFIKQ